MQVIPNRATALRALETKRNELLLEDKKDEARQVESDRRLIAKADGDDLYQMTQLAQQKARKLENNILVKDARAGWPVGPIGFGLGLGGAAVGGVIGYTLDAVVHAPVEISLPVGMVAIIGGLMCAFIPDHFHGQYQNAQATAQAIDRNFSFIQSFTGAPQGKLAMADFQRLGAAREQELLVQGQPMRAADLRHVCDSVGELKLATLEESLDEVFRRAHDGPEQKRWEQVLGKVQDSPDVLGLVRSMLEVDTLSGALDGRGGSLEVRPDAVRIGSVTLRPKR